MIRAKKSLGQHFLVDKNISRKIVRAVTIEDGDTIIEIGPGTGALTDLFVETSARIIAVDIDERAVALLTQRYKGEQAAKIEVIRQDILKCGISSLNVQGKVKVAGNLPYNITSQILFKLFEEHESVSLAVCMTQREVAERICAKHGTKEYGILSVLTQVHANAKILFRVSPNVFHPKPDVWSAVIRLDFGQNKLPEIISYKHFVAIVKGGFGTRRKTLGNALKNATLLPSTVPNAVEPYLKKRAEQLSIDDFIRLSNALSTYEC